MNKTSIVLSHIDLDGFSAGYLACKMFDTNIVANVNYNVVMKQLEKFSRDYGYVDIIITDLNILPEELKYALDNFKTVKIFDHHPSSADFIPLQDINPRFEIYFSEEVCATTLVQTYMMEHGHEFTDIEKNFFRYVNVYDVWKPDHKEFIYGRMANDLFWHYGGKYFVQKMRSNGVFDIPTGLSHEELQLCKKTFDTIKKAGLEAEWYSTDCDSTIVILKQEEKVAINHISEYKPSGTGIYYIVYYGTKGFNCSSRTNTEHRGNYNLGAEWKEFLKESDLINNCGGHKDASGLGFNKDVTLPEALDEIERFDSFLFERLSQC